MVISTNQDVPIFYAHILRLSQRVSRLLLKSRRAIIGEGTFRTKCQTIRFNEFSTPTAFESFLEPKRSARSPPQLIRREGKATSLLKTDKSQVQVNVDLFQSMG
ncbi:hypothetical protein TNCV_3430781 [Trichonephila clavipes]|nr:hypothetical protein TNCV_3430781 [Trichonephila clavipes]